MWDDFIDLKEELYNTFTFFNELPVHDHQPDLGHYNYFWKSTNLDMGHISVVDKRESHSVWMMHVNAYSKGNYPMPIYGFDVVCGKNKVTGCFHDISPTGYNDFPVHNGFEETKRRELPDWAKEIFSEGMVAAGNVKQADELGELINIGASNLMTWHEVLNSLEETKPEHYYDNARKKYCQNQLMNPHSFAVMVKLGFPEDYLRNFKMNKQFPY